MLATKISTVLSLSSLPRLLVDKEKALLPRRPAGYCGSDRSSAPVIYWWKIHRRQA